MRHFYLYLIKEEFASHYFGREMKLYQLFHEYLWTSRDQHRYTTMKQQIDYVSKKIPVVCLDELIRMYLGNQDGYQHVSPIHKYFLSNSRGRATLLLKEPYIEITATGSFEAETVFFEILRKFDCCFLAMDFKNEQYGWLNPIKERKYV